MGLAAMLMPIACLGADVSVDGETLRFSGRIFLGDADKVQAALGPAIQKVVLTSLGGDMEEGIRIGEMFSRSHLQVIVEHYCMSSCANYLFTAGRERTVSHGSVVCYHGGSPRNDEDLKAFFLHVARQSHVDELVSDQDLQNLIVGIRGEYDKYAEEEANLLRQWGIKDEILANSDVRMVPRKIIGASDLSVRRFMEAMNVVWCPSPDLLRRYGIETEGMWYPASEDDLYRVGRRLSPRFVLVAHSAADLAERGDGGEAARRYVPTGPYEASGDLGVEIDLADLYNNIGVKEVRAGQIDLGLQDYAISLRLKPDSPWPHNNRGVVYASQERYAEAIAEYDAALRLAPDNVATRHNRGVAYEAEGRHREAIAELSAVAPLRPDRADVYADRGTAYFNSFQFAAATADFKRSLLIDPKQPYAVLWLHMARARTGSDDAEELARNAAGLDQSAWPRPVIAYFEGRMNAAQLETVAATAGDPKTRNERGCEASFYLGEDALVHSDIGRAERLLGTAHRTCPTAFIEYRGAESELERLERPE